MESPEDIREEPGKDGSVDAGQPEVAGLVDKPIKKYDYRHHCGRLLMRGYLPPGTNIDIRCPSCGKMWHMNLPLLFETPIPIVKGE